jgi:hypothetical protein
MEKERRHFSIFWPILLITVGIVLFLNNIGTISGGTWEVIWNLWPLLFIVGGIDGLVNRSGFAGPMVGIGLGTIFLLGNFGYLPVPALDVLIKFWPVLLIAWGIDLIIDHRGSWSPVVGLLLGAALIAGTYYLAMYSPAIAQSTETQPLALERNSATVANGTLSMPMGQLVLKNGAADKYLLEGTATASGNVNSSVQVNGTSATFWVKDTTEGTYTPFSSVVTSLNWNFKLNKDVAYELDSNMGAGSSDFNLQGLKVGGLNTSTGVGKLVVTLPETGNETVQASMAVGQVIIYVPQDAAVRVQLGTALVLPTYPADFMKSGNVVFSPEAATASEVQVVKVDSAVGLVSIQYLP